MQNSIYWGDVHSQFSRASGPYGRNPDVVRNMERAFVAAQENVEFLPIVYYPVGHYRTKDGLWVETQGPRPEFERDWKQVLELVRCYNAPGKFVAFPGYEWTGNRMRYGDHNVFYFDEGPLDLSDGVEELFAHLRQRRAMAISHHTAYQVGQRGRDWDHHDEQLSPFAEIYSVHGCSEGSSTPVPMDRNGSMGPRVSGGTPPFPRPRTERQPG